MAIFCVSDRFSDGGEMTRAMEAMMKMSKINIAEVEHAADSV